MVPAVVSMVVWLILRKGTATLTSHQYLPSLSKFGEVFTAELSDFDKICCAGLGVAMTAGGAASGACGPPCVSCAVLSVSAGVAGGTGGCPGGPRWSGGPIGRC